MTSILIIEKSGAIKSLKAKDVAFDNLYKKAGFKSAEGFKSHVTWPVSIGQDAYQISVFGKAAGKAGQENKYDFPPPIDSTLFFGPCVLVNTDAENRILDLSVDTWAKVYEHLFGGFEDIGKDADDEDLELDTDEELEALKSSGQIVKHTKQGYAKDGFIVDSDEAEDVYESEEDLEIKPAKKVVCKIKTQSLRATKKQPKKKSKVAEPEPEETELSYLDCTSELKEEEYV